MEDPWGGGSGGILDDEERETWSPTFGADPKSNELQPLSQRHSDEAGPDGDGGDGVGDDRGDRRSASDAKDRPVAIGNRDEPVIDEPPPTRCCGMIMSSNAKSLITSACLFFLITGLQYVASLPRFANSLALQADCLSMFVDGVSYLGNLAAECNPNAATKRLVEMAVAGVSLSILLGFTVFFIYDAVQHIVRETDDEEDVNPSIGWHPLSLHSPLSPSFGSFSIPCA